MDELEFFELAKGITDSSYKTRIDNGLVIANLLAGIAEELRILNKTMKEGLVIKK